MKKLLIATTNQGKLKEYKSLLKSLPLEIVSLKDFKIKKTAKENGKTFKENAIKKAEFYFKISKIATLADDGGLEIDYLKGEPGIKSHRWPGYEATDRELMEYALKKLEGVPWQKRKAQFRSVSALIVSKNKIFTEEGKKMGIITTKPKGKIIPGYPFRSIFYLPKYKKTFSKLSPKEKKKIISHRKQAIRKLIPILKSEMLDK